MYFKILIRPAPLLIGDSSHHEFESNTITLQLSGEGDLPCRDWMCVVSCERKLSDKAMEAFDEIIATPDDAALQKKWEPSWEQRNDGEYEGPLAYRDLVDRVKSDMLGFAHRCLSLIQWRLRLDGSHRPIEHCGRLQWSRDGTTWHFIPGHQISGRVSIRPFEKLNANVHDCIQEALDAKAPDLLPHELLWEAESQSDKAPRSAFVVAVTSLEVGVKQCISQLAPDTAWLLKNLPSPPVERLIYEQLPLLPGKCLIGEEVLPPPLKMHNVDKAIRTIVSMRNDIAHKGDHRKTVDKLEATIAIVRDVLYLMDYYMGHEWALRSVSRETLEGLGFERTENGLKRITAK